MTPAAMIVLQYCLAALAIFLTGAAAIVVDEIDRRYLGLFPRRSKSFFNDNTCPHEVAPDHLALKRNRASDHGGFDV